MDLARHLHPGRGPEALRTTLEQLVDSTTVVVRPGNIHSLGPWRRSDTAAATLPPMNGSSATATSVWTARSFPYPTICRFENQTRRWQADVVSITTLADLPGRPCPIAAALEVVGERWALLVIREIALDNSRFCHIVAGTGAPRDRVAARLKSLEDAGVVTRVAYQCAPSRFDYRLTTSGRALLPVLDALLTWGRDHVVAQDDPNRDRHLARITPSSSDQ